MNLALDESCIADLLNGKTPDEKYVEMRKKTGLSPYQIDPKDGKLYPLKILTNLIQSDTIRVPPSKEDLSENRFMLTKSPRNTNNDDNDSNSPGKKRDYKSLMRPIVVLSVGSSDIRNHLSYGQFDLIVNALEENNLRENLDKVVKFLTKNLRLEVILV